MILTVDIGNSNIVIGAYGPEHSSGSDPVASWRLATDRTRTDDEYRLLLRQLWQEQDYTAASFAGSAISSVVAPLSSLWRQVLEDLLGTPPLLLHHGLVTTLSIGVAHPERLGIDRLVDGVAAYHRYGGPCIAIDFGTATTFNVVDAQGVFVGGAIAPGLGTVSSALVERANALPPVALAPPDRAIGQDTVPALQSGLIFGYVGLVEGLLSRMRGELGRAAPAVATGGLGHIIAPLTPAIDDYDPWLTLAGIRTIYGLNYATHPER